MTVLKDRLEKLLYSYDETNPPLSDANVSEALRGLYEEHLEQDEESGFLLLSEQMAFGFAGSNSEDKYGWGTFYGPRAVMQGEDGQFYEVPSVKLVTPEMLQYWSVRAKAAKHPFLRLRYADLVWDFTKKITDNSPDFRLAHTAIDTTIELVKSDKLNYKVEAIRKLERGLSIALSINDEERVEAIKAIMLAFEDEIADDRKAGLWGFSFDNLLLNKNVSLSNLEKEKILNDLEDRLTRLIENSEEGSNVFAAERAAMRLARYYQNTGQLDEMRRVISKYGAAAQKAATSAGAVAGLSQLQQLHKVYINFGMKEEADKLAPDITKTARKTRVELREVPHTINIPIEEVEKIYDGMLIGSLDEVLNRIALSYVPDFDETANFVRTLAKENPLTFLIPHSLLDEKGRPIARIGPIEEDFDGRVVVQLSEYLHISAIFLREAIKRTFEKFSLTTEMIVTHIYQSPVFQPEYKSLILQGINAYVNNEHVSAIHILIPQIERPPLPFRNIRRRNL